MFRRSPEPELGRVPLFAGLSQRELATVERLTTPVEVPAGKVLAREGSVGTEFFIVLDGRVDVVQGNEVIATRGSGSHLGEIALLSDRTRTATLVATTPVRTAVASRREFALLLEEVPSLTDRLEATMAARLAA